MNGTHLAFKSTFAFVVIPYQFRSVSIVKNTGWFAAADREVVIPYQFRSVSIKQYLLDDGSTITAKS